MEVGCFKRRLNENTGLGTRNDIARYTVGFPHYDAAVVQKKRKKKIKTKNFDEEHERGNDK